jgi:hypothetical protein
MRGIFAIVALLLAAAAPAAAQQFVPANSHERAAMELIEITKGKEGNAAAIDLMAEAMMAQNPMAAEFRDILIDFYKEHMKWQELLPEYVRIYRETYSEAELRELIAFYKTPIGQKVVERSPRFTQKTTAVVQELMQKHMPELQRRIMERMMGGGMR